ncbi:MAG: hypothetical protein C3F12_12920 [Candidatus Methylomirabilota bacterium]|nr:DUF721 domain-containing protein [Candidatus Methylomirabilis sp.]PWB42816.1 MAG: hypothetical protein C3F12_12920 [candidate division NC10 bacterium]
MKRGAPGQRSAHTPPARCAEILENSLHGLGFDRVIRHLALRRAWDRAVAQRIRERATVEDFRGGCLYLCVEDPIWMHELHMLRHQLKTILNAEVGEPVVTEIVLRIGRIRRHADRTYAPRGGRTEARTVPPEMEAGIATLLNPLQDLPWCDAVQRLFRRWAGRSP